MRKNSQILRIFLKFIKCAFLVYGLVCSVKMVAFFMQVGLGTDLLLL